jgi:hypothetical protein
MEIYTMFDPQVFKCFVKPDTGEIVEIRALGCYGTAPGIWDGYARGTVHGFFDDHDQFCKFTKYLMELAKQRANVTIFFTLQVINPELIGRAYNRLVPAQKGTTDKDVVAYRHLPVDLDPVRPSGISSSDEELEKATGLSDQISSDLSDKWGAPIKAMSGNGCHLLFPLDDLDAQDPKNQKYVKDLLEKLSAKYSNEHVKVDTTLYNPAQLIKLYGTVACKGDPVPPGPNRVRRPHRKSYIYCLGDAGRE